MYKRNAQGWSKHLDFILLDELSLQIAFIIAIAIRNHVWAFSSPLYRSLAFMLILIDALILTFNNSMHDVIHRGYYIEAVETLKHCFFVFAIATIFMFATQSGGVYSRIVLFLTFLFHDLIGYVVRILWKVIIKKHGLVSKKKNNMLVVTTRDNAENILERLSEDELANYKVTGVVIAEDSDVETIAGYPIVTNIDDAADYIVKKWIDSVYIDAPLSNEKVVQLMNDCMTMAVPTHYHVHGMSQNEAKNFPEKIGGTTVLTTSINYVTPAQMLIKRCFDIVAGLLGSVIALIIIAVVGPIIKKQSPGPILFTQERIGQNGKPFKMYKIRSMYMDAEERKKDLMDQNRVKDGMMFKLDFDPRIIGNEILPDGTRKTGIGEFIRKTSLDEFPQFFCVLKGDMSTVGTRPPLPSEYSLYKYHHRARMAIKPGITGMWQVNGRSDITDFEEVVRLDTEYITNWSIGMDLRILFKTIGVMFSKKGAM